jgi:hypothetical protein
MKTIYIRDFILNGNFGPVKIGMSKAEIIRELGEPEADNVCSEGETGILLYAYYEFFYWSDTQILYAIQNDHLQADCSNHAEMILFENDQFTIDPWFLEVGKSFTYAEVKNILDAEAIEYLEEISYKNGPAILKFSRGALLDFSSGNITWDKKNGVRETNIEMLESNILNGIRYFPLDVNI